VAFALSLLLSLPPVSSAPITPEGKEVDSPVHPGKEPILVKRSAEEPSASADEDEDEESGRDPFPMVRSLFPNFSRNSPTSLQIERNQFVSPPF